MKYMIESTDNGCVETLEYMGLVFKQEYERIEGGLLGKNKPLSEQMRNAGIDDDEVIYKVSDVFESFLASDFIDLAEMYGE